MSLFDSFVRVVQSTNFLLGSILFILAGCVGSSATTEVNKSVEVPLGVYQVVAVDVVLEIEDSESVSIADQLTGSVIANLREYNLFKKVYSKSATLEKNFDLIILISPTEVRNADVAQAWVGVFGGRSQIEVDVNLIDGKTGEKLGSSTIIGQSADKTTIFTSASVAQTIERVGEQIAKYVAQNI